MSAFEQNPAATGEDEFELELATAALELAGVPANAFLPEGETGLGAATALAQMVSLLAQSGGLSTSQDQQLALALGLKQVDADGQRLRGTLNKPDISYVAAGRRPGRFHRVNIEIESDKPFQHLRQVRRDKNATNVFVKVHPWTGQIEQAWLLKPGQTGRPRALKPIEVQNLQNTLPKPVRDPSLRTDRAGKQRRNPSEKQPVPRLGSRRSVRPLREFEMALENELEVAAFELESG
jgi:hypothetical protein